MVEQPHFPPTLISADPVSCSPPSRASLPSVQSILVLERMTANRTSSQPFFFILLPFLHSCIPYRSSFCATNPARFRPFSSNAAGVILAASIALTLSFNSGVASLVRPCRSKEPPSKLRISRAPIARPECPIRRSNQLGQNRLCNRRLGRLGQNVANAIQIAILHRVRYRASPPQANQLSKQSSRLGIVRATKPEPEKPLCMGIGMQLAVDLAPQLECLPQHGLGPIDLASPLEGRTRLFVMKSVRKLVAPRISVISLTARSSSGSASASLPS